MKFACVRKSVMNLQEYASIVLCVFSILHSLEGFPSGAPLSACSHLMPVHIDGELMESASPYLLLLNDTEYSTHPLSLTVTTIGPNARNFMAFMLQARSEFGEPVGHFSHESLPGASKTISCYGKDDTLTHTAAFIRPAMELIWHPPGKNVGKISITGSVAVTKDHFWAVRSEPLKGIGKLVFSLTNPQQNSSNFATPLTQSVLLWIYVITLLLIVNRLL